MKIDKFIKQRNGQYKVLFDNSEFILLHEDLILKYNLLVKKEIDEKLKERLLIENTNYIAYDLSIKYISNKMRSVWEVKQYLIKKEVVEETVNNVVYTLIKYNYLNDDLYCKLYITDRINLSNDGPYKIINHLKNNLIKEEFINKNISIYTKEIETRKIEKLIDKQVKTNHNKGSYVLRQKINKYLIDLGYSKSIIIQELNKISIDDSKLYKKEYDKLYNTLSKRYEGIELEYRIKQKLYQKGFTMTE